MRKPLTIDEYVRAGAWYRFWKDISTHAALEVGKVFQTKAATGKMLTVARKVGDIECDLGLERMLISDHPEMESCQFCSVFYGAIGTERHTEIDERINREIIQICMDLIETAKKGLNE